ncbi:hypothetical protein KGF57_001022 [Candida theae]|uniref:Glutaredoxin domain-containing protein n=1 Tax=Candida theae TaxID=1198502 RepID=A0AAD5BHY8_9ASCO|nr:uncharacterized protein KGF57_001022 [Candida theae]KAI5964530.1 hypothetical protein KGF57_001022 [Candida theae]
MDFEERLAGAERSDSPSLVGASLRSADDSPHQNYIHPEKYVSSRAESRSKSRTRSSKLRSSITASLDDLINEGALLGSEEDFDKFLDGDGTVKNEAKYTSKLDKDIDEAGEEEDTEEEGKHAGDGDNDEVQQKIANAIKQDEPLRGRRAKVDDKKLQHPVESESETETKSAGAKNVASSFYKQSDYSTPNLSDYQLDQNITDHSDFVSHVQSHDLDKLPRSKSSFASEKESESLRPKIHTTLSSAQQQRLESSLHPFHTDRPRSRSRSANPTTRIAARSSSSSSSSRHLARGDSYRNVHGDEPSKYELPPSFSSDDLKESEEEEGRGRAARPTLGDTIAAAEARKARSETASFVPEYESNPISREPSLVTTGDYTNFDVDNPPRSPAKYKPNARFIRSSSSHPMDEKNDSNVDGLVEEGALVTDDPYASIDQLDNLMEEVLRGNSASSESKNETEKGNSVKAKSSVAKGEDDTKVKESLKAQKENEDVPSDTAEDVKNDAGDKNKDPVSRTEEDASSSTELKEDKEKEDKEKEKEKSEFHKAEDSKEANGKETTTSSGKDLEKSAKGSTHEELIDEDAKRAEIEGNEKDDADTTALKEEGALTSNDPFERIEESELREGTTNDESTKEKSRESEETSGNQSSHLETSRKKPEDNLIQGSLNTDGPADLEKLEEEEAEGRKENELEKEEEKEGKIPKDEEAELESAEKNKPNLIVGGDDEIDSVAKEDSREADGKESAKEKAISDAAPDSETSVFKEAEESKSAKVRQSEPEETDGTSKTEGLHKDSSDKLLEGTLNADGPEELKEDEEEEGVVKSPDESGAKNETKDGKEDEIEPESNKVDGVDEKSDSSKESKENKASEQAGVTKDIEAPAAKDESGTNTSAKESTSTTPVQTDSTTDGFDDLEDISPAEIRKHLESQPIYIFTSLAGGAQIIPRTNRLATILQANGIKFEYRDLGTDEEAKKIWRRQANGKTLPGVVRGDDYVGNWQEVDEANEEYQVKDLLYSF